MIGNLQILRALAASAVVIYHCNILFFGNHTDFAAVAVFFALSGYLMCRIREKRSAFDFSVDRFWRIVPSYWLATAIVVWKFQPHAAWGHVVHTLLFIPHDSASGFFPLLGVGWTLNMEVYFYVIFTLAIFVSRRFAPLIASAAIVVIYVGLPYVTTNQAIIFYYTHPYVLYFLGGIAVWYLSEWLRPNLVGFSVPVWTFPVTLAVYMFIVGIVLADVGSQALGLLVVSSLLFAAVVASSAGGDIKSTLLLVLGNASYACYLLHTIVLELFRHRHVEIDGSYTITAIVFASSWAVALAWHFTVERIVSKWAGKGSSSRKAILAR